MLPTIEPELTEDQKEQLEEARRMIPKLKEQIRRAKLAGIDVGDQETELLNLEQQLEKLHRVYVRSTTSPK